MKNISRLPLLLMSIATLFFASCGEMKNNVKNPDIVSDENTYVALGDFTSEQFTLPGRVVALDVDFDNSKADLTLYNFSIDGENTMDILAQGLTLTKTSNTTCTFTIDQVVPIVKLADKDVLYTSCPLVGITGKVDVEAKTMVINFTLDYTTPFMEKMQIPVVFNGTLLEGNKKDEVVEDAKKTINYTEEYAATGVLKVDGKIIPENVLRVGIAPDQQKAKLYLATMSLDNGKTFVTLGVEEINAIKAANGYKLEAATAVAVLETGAQSIYYTACKFQNLTGRIDKQEGIMEINVTFVYTDPETKKTHEYLASFYGTLEEDPDDAEDPVNPVLYAHNYLAIGDFNADEYTIGNRMVGVDLHDNTADVTFYAFSYGDQVPEITVLTSGLELQKTENGYTCFISEVTPYVQTVGQNVEFKDARFVNQEVMIDTNAKTMEIHFTIEYTDPNTSQMTALAASYYGTLAE